ncbi:MAG: hypothetical protein A3F84_16840 [Candidatus Handelsmanbacteria bacterium RIFCSPLOWO2_12_FULL_64_10]|uniref:PspA-associated domain-containing protein n=1 Tax=Handelsmanbacteria sp. (strain RIFCSPLOWO2_12_FULL_64_10) TaxID=1817868 RepID=A0A1F6CKK5_HANXR|nr:MAG: hypothetical protein A3F84_16840 [Candidatus Handelsmanbacteria bacterium RIFCSPLOWO2_12_FULL_64_10]
MIVRIASEGQFRLDDSLAVQLNDFDNQLVQVVDSGSEAQFAPLLARMLDFVRSKGQPMADDDLSASQVVLPPPDIDFDEAQHLFKGDGLIAG